MRCRLAIVLSLVMTAVRSGTAPWSFNRRSRPLAGVPAHDYALAKK